MILEFGFKNYFSFKEGLDISFRLTPSCPESISMGNDFSTAIGIKGANASGKTNVFRAISFLGMFCTKSFNSTPEADIPIASYFDSKDPSEFYVEFRIKDIEYRYELVTTNKKVIRETIYTKKSRKTKIIERIDNKITYHIKSLEGLSKIRLRENSSIISIAHQFESKGLVECYNFFNLIRTNVGFAGVSQKGYDIYAVSELLYKRKDILEFVKNFIMECDVGVDDIIIAKRIKEDGVAEYFPGFIHKENKKRHPVPHITESSGTGALFKQLALYKTILDTGGFLALDEFDVYLHPHILPKLLDLFLDSKNNPKNAQVIFSTHQTDIIDILGRYRTYLINKINNESFGYRLDEVPGDILRNDRPISPAYNDGKIGGVPKL